MDAKPLVQCLYDDLSGVIDNYRDQGLTMAETVGALEMVKLDVWYGDESDIERDHFG